MSSLPHLNLINENGARLIDLCESISLKFINGFYSENEIHKFTWTIKGKSRINFWLHNNEPKFHIKNVWHEAVSRSKTASYHQIIITKVLITYRKEIGQQANNAVNKKYNLETLTGNYLNLYILILATKLQNVVKLLRTIYRQHGTWVILRSEETVDHSQTKRTRRKRIYTNVNNQYKTLANILQKLIAVDITPPARIKHVIAQSVIK